jgi:hypothetical protein
MRVFAFFSVILFRFIVLHNHVAPYAHCLSDAREGSVKERARLSGGLSGKSDVKSLLSLPSFLLVDLSPFSAILPITHIAMTKEGVVSCCDSVQFCNGFGQKKWLTLSFHVHF